jgi:hypothetical protein
MAVAPRQSAQWADDVLQMRKRRVAAIEKLEKMRDSTVFVFWNLDELRGDDFLTLADMLEEENPSKNVDFIVTSPGGNGEAGYRIGHTFQQWAARRELSFRVVIPLYAKSAATILALGAHELVMGVHSEIGPIDLQIAKIDKRTQRWRYVPAMAVMDGLKLVGEYIETLPAMGSFFQEILGKEELSLEELGVLERLRESGKQYGELLLQGGMIPNPEVARKTVERLSDYYKFHGHPIDAFDAEQNLKLNVKHSDGMEWAAIKELRAEFQEFVGQPGLIPGTVVTSVVECAKLRSWRYVPLESSRTERMVKQVIERDSGEVIRLSETQFDRYSPMVAAIGS